MASQDSMETQVLKFEWIVRNVGELFESSKGDTKSRVTKSPKFGGGRWQILFYANSGAANSEGYTYVSLYLSCEPTPEERENSVNGPDKWARDGIYKFSFDLRNFQKTILFQTKEANNHSFTWKTVNWGWAQYARRDQIYYNASTVRHSDALVIICTISTIPAPPVSPSSTLYRRVPRNLLSSIGSLLDDPVYSDIEFVLPRRHQQRRHKGSQIRTIYASRKILQRVDYFDTMFHSGFAEGSSRVAISTGDTVADDASSTTHVDAEMTDIDADEEGSDRKIHKFEDSDDEDDYHDWENDMSYSEDDQAQPNVPAQRMSLQITSTSDDHEDPKDTPAPPRLALPSSIAEESETALGDRSTEGNNNMDDAEEEGKEERNVRPKLSHPSSPRTPQRTLLSQNPFEHAAAQFTSSNTTQNTEKPLPGPSKVRVVVKDAPYATYRAVLYYIYTDTIVFAPLASSFTSYSTTAILRSPGVQTPAAPMSEKGEGAFPSKSLPLPPDQPRSRRAWIKEWQEENPGRPKPCSAKAVYRLADRFDLPELKERAFQHIVKSLTVENVAYEVFSDFSAAFEDVRKVEVEFFLENWSKIRSSDTMRNVWQQIRVGRHPGFEDVWPFIAENLEFKPKEDQSE